MGLASQGSSPSATIRRVVSEWIRRLPLGLLGSRTCFCSCSPEKNKHPRLGNCRWALPGHWNAESSCRFYSYLLTSLKLEIGHWNATVEQPTSLQSCWREQPKAAGVGLPLTLPSKAHVSASSWWNLNFIQNLNCTWIGKIDLFVSFNLSSFYSWIKHTWRMREWSLRANWSYPQNLFFCCLVIFKLFPLLPLFSLYSPLF